MTRALTVSIDAMGGDAGPGVVVSVCDSVPREDVSDDNPGM